MMRLRDKLLTNKTTPQNKTTQSTALFWRARKYNMDFILVTLALLGFIPAIVLIEKIIIGVIDACDHAYNRIKEHGIEISS
jgi:hypothetical protein